MMLVLDFTFYAVNTLAMRHFCNCAMSTSIVLFKPFTKGHYLVKIRETHFCLEYRTDALLMDVSVSSFEALIPSGTRLL